MNILIATLGSYGDVYPMVGLGVRLARRGHDVTLLTNPFFEDLARKYGLDLVPIGTRHEYERFANQHDNAWRLKRLGVGDWIASRDWQVPDVAAKLAALTTSTTVREHCQRVADRFVGTDPLMETCELVESALPGGAPGKQSSLAPIPTWRGSALAMSSSAGKI